MANMIKGVAVIGQDISDITDGRLCIHLEDTHLIDASALPVNAVEMKGVVHRLGQTTQLRFEITVPDDAVLSHLSVRAVLYADKNATELQPGDCVTTQHYPPSTPNLMLELKQI